MYKKYFLILFFSIFLFQLSTFGQKVELFIFRQSVKKYKTDGIGINFYIYNKKRNIIFRPNYSYRNFNHTLDESYEVVKKFVDFNVHIHELSYSIFKSNKNTIFEYGIGCKHAFHYNIGKKEINIEMPDWEYHKDIQLSKTSTSFSGILFLSTNNIISSKISLKGEVEGGVLYNGNIPGSEYLFPELVLYYRFIIGISYKFNSASNSEVVY